MSSVVMLQCCAVALRRQSIGNLFLKNTDKDPVIVENFPLLPYTNTHNHKKNHTLSRKRGADRELPIAIKETHSRNIGVTIDLFVTTTHGITRKKCVAQNWCLKSHFQLPQQRSLIRSRAVKHVYVWLFVLLFNYTEPHFARKRRESANSHKKRDMNFIKQCGLAVERKQHKKNRTPTHRKKKQEKLLVLIHTSVSAAAPVHNAQCGCTGCPLCVCSQECNRHKTRIQ